MNTEFKKLLVFGVIISFLTTIYMSFLATVMRQGFGGESFLMNWLFLIPRTYLVVLPFVLVTGPLVRRLVERMFSRSKTG